MATTIDDFNYQKQMNQNNADTLTRKGYIDRGMNNIQYLANRRSVDRAKWDAELAQEQARYNNQLNVLKQEQGKYANNPGELARIDRQISALATEHKNNMSTISQRYIDEANGPSPKNKELTTEEKKNLAQGTSNIASSLAGYFTDKLAQQDEAPGAQNLRNQAALHDEQAAAEEANEQESRQIANRDYRGEAEKNAVAGAAVENAQKVANLGNVSAGAAALARGVKSADYDTHMARQDEQREKAVQKQREAYGARQTAEEERQAAEAENNDKRNMDIYNSLSRYLSMGGNKNVGNAEEEDKKTDEQQSAQENTQPSGTGTPPAGTQPGNNPQSTEPDNKEPETENSTVPPERQDTTTSVDSEDTEPEPNVGQLGKSPVSTKKDEWADLQDGETVVPEQEYGDDAVRQKVDKSRQNMQSETTTMLDNAEEDKKQLEEAAKISEELNPWDLGMQPSVPGITSPDITPGYDDSMKSAMAAWDAAVSSDPDALKNLPFTLGEGLDGQELLDDMNNYKRGDKSNVKNQLAVAAYLLQEQGLTDAVRDGDWHTVQDKLFALQGEEAVRAYNKTANYDLNRLINNAVAVIGEAAQGQRKPEEAVKAVRDLYENVYGLWKGSSVEKRTQEAVSAAENNPKLTVQNTSFWYDSPNAGKLYEEANSVPYTKVLENKDNYPPFMQYAAKTASGSVSAGRGISGGTVLNSYKAVRDRVYASDWYKKLSAEDKKLLDDSMSEEQMKALYQSKYNEMLPYVQGILKKAKEPKAPPYNAADYANSNMTAAQKERKNQAASNQLSAAFQTWAGAASDDQWEAYEDMDPQEEARFQGVLDQRTPSDAQYFYDNYTDDGKNVDKLGNMFGKMFQDAVMSQAKPKGYDTAGSFKFDASALGDYAGQFAEAYDELSDDRKANFMKLPPDKQLSFARLKVGKGDAADMEAFAGMDIDQLWGIGFNKTSYEAILEHNRKKAESDARQQNITDTLSNIKY